MTAAITQILACSGPGAGSAIESNILLSLVAAGIGGIITAAVVYDRFRRHTRSIPGVIAACFMLIHPAWTISGYKGDCGILKATVSFIFTGVFIALIIWQRFLRSRLHREGMCRQCGYDLRGSASGRCPECGHPNRPMQLTRDSRDG